LVDSSLAIPHLERDRGAHAFYRGVMRSLDQAGVPFLIGGAYALWRYTGVSRDTKDLDLFIDRGDWGAAGEALAASRITTELTFPHWLGKARRRGHFVDLIFNSGNGVTPVDEHWFKNAREADVYDMRVKLCPPEELVWSKSFVMERERFDGADVAHTLHALGSQLDWPRLLARYGHRWQVLLAHVVLFDFIYPDRRGSVPSWVREELLTRGLSGLAEPGGLGGAEPAPRRCQGTLLSRAQYLVDVERWGYEDARTADGAMTPAEVSAWTAAIGRK
jgi:hypothetical protein